MPITSHKDLIVYQKALDLVEFIYSETAHFPSDEKFGITSQMRRCAISVPSNIAEGAGRKSKKEFIHFLYISLGSLMNWKLRLKLHAASAIFLLSKLLMKYISR